MNSTLYLHSNDLLQEKNERGRKSISVGSVLTDGGFNLIEMIGVMAIVAILALALAPVFIKELDQLAGDKEVKQLKALGEAFRQGVLKTKSIPDQTGWDTMVATNIGLEINQVRLNDRRVPRIFLIDPDIAVGGNGGKLPYNQTGGSQVNGAGNIIPPINPRVMILSSISAPLPVSLTNGLPPATTGAYAFSNIWNTAEGTVPAGWSWTGQNTDLKVQRINLMDLFVPLILNNTSTNWVARYTIETNFYNVLVAPSATAGSSFQAYFIDGTQLGLYDTNPTPNLQYSEILHSAKSFDFVNNWQGQNLIGLQVHHPDPYDLQLVELAFLASGHNPHAPTTVTVTNVWQDMIAYMQDYVAWSDAGLVTSGTLYNNVTTDQTTLKNDSSSLISK